MPDAQERPHWRLAFAKRTSADGIFGNGGEIVDTWVESADPTKIKSIVARGAYTSDEPLRLSLVSPKPPRTKLTTVICTPEAIAAWDPATADLPDGQPETAANGAIRVTRLSVVRDVHVAMVAAVASGMINQVEADLVVQHVRGLLVRRS